MSKPNGIASVVKWLPLGLTLVGMIVAGSIAWGQQNEKTKAHEVRIGQNEKIVRQLETGQATILERTKNIIDNQKTYQEESNATMKAVLRELRQR